MNTVPKIHKPHSAFVRAVVEIGFIIFLFYSNLLMGEFTRGGMAKRTFTAALYDIVDVRTFGIALAAASIGFVGFDYLRKRL